MNLRSITMGQALETIAQESRIVRPIMFISPESLRASYGTWEESLRDVMEELPQQ